eukprot:scaffold23612_cov66-Phaeocystis_antarctica.AAC.1
MPRGPRPAERARASAAAPTCASTASPRLVVQVGSPRDHMRAEREITSKGELMHVTSSNNENTEREELRRTPLDFSRHKQRLQTGNGEVVPE